MRNELTTENRQDAEKALFTLSYGTVPTSTKLALGCLVPFFLIPVAVAIYKTVIAGSNPKLVLFFILSTLPYLAFVLFILLKTSKAKIACKENAISFSPQWKASLLGRLERDWHDVHSVQIVADSSNIKSLLAQLKGEPGLLAKLKVGLSPDSSAQLCIDFKSGGSAFVRLCLLTKQELEDLIFQLDKHVDPSRFSQDYIRLQKALYLEDAGAHHLSSIWDEDLNLRYISTNYVPLQAGAQLANYTVLMALATGGMSAVYLAKDKQRKVVLKELVLSHLTSEEQAKAKELFDREASLLLKIKHDQIATVLDKITENGRHYLVLEYISGLTLRQHIKQNGKEKPSTAVKFGLQMANILQYLHSQVPPILHRDFTPDNLIIKDDGSLCLIDFGAANEYVGRVTGTMIGKQCYIAPEQLQGKASPASDIYAMGATLFFVLSGEDPLPLSASKPELDTPEQDTPEQDAKKQQLAELIERLTAFAEEERVQTSNEAFEALRDLRSL